MLLFCGDFHGDIRRFYKLNKTYPSLSEDDCLIVCGDFGFLFRNDRSENVWLDDLSTQPYNICFVDGNHENFNAINSYPVEEWCGGKVHKIRANIIHLMRGQVFNISGKNIFTMGGAYSIDRYVRRLNESYWEEEIPNDFEYKEATINLKKTNYKVDYIVTHTAPRELIYKMGYYPDPHDMELTGFLEWIYHEVSFNEWFFGHWHEDIDFNNMHALFFRVLTR